jgi:hypothetical protein
VNYTGHELRLTFRDGEVSMSGHVFPTPALERAIRRVEARSGYAFETRDAGLQGAHVCRD